MAGREVILTEKAPVPTSGYSQALRRGDLVVTSGYLGTAPDGSGLVGGGFAAEAHVIGAVRRVLLQAGCQTMLTRNGE